MVNRTKIASLRPYLALIAGVLVFRFVCYALMTALALWNEQRIAPTLPDLVMGAVPFVRWVSRINYLAWLFLYVPLALALLLTEPRRWIRYMFTGGIISLLRGACIALTGLGAPDPAHAGHGIRGRAFLDVYLDLLSPLGVFSRNTAHAYLTKDLFFSGHTATTFLIVLYLWHRPRLRIVAIIAHVIVVATVVLSHLHYSIDIVGAWFVTFAVYTAREWKPREI